MDKPRLIEVAFPLKQTSLDSVHEKNVRHGHISTLHIWPARRPLAASRAALIATLLPDPGDAEARKELLHRLAGEVKLVSKKKKLANGKIEEKLVEETVGGILHWGRESGPDLDWFRQKIREAYGGRAPKVLDPFAGGGAIPLEAMRLGCDVTAIDINPVAWFILKCTLEYPQQLAGQTRPLPQFAIDDEEFMTEFRKTRGVKSNKAGKGRKSKRQTDDMLAPTLPLDLLTDTNADLAWHIRAWGRWVLERAKADLERFYPVVDGKPTVAYLWARTVTCKNCRATIPLLKTRWLCKKENKRVLLTMQPNGDRTGVTFGIQNDVPQAKGSAAHRREHDKKLGGGTMSKAGATCPCCGVIMTSEDIRLEGQSGRLDTTMTAVVVASTKGKEYRLPLTEEICLAKESRNELESTFAHIPFGLPEELIPQGGSRTGGGSPFTVYLYGLTNWSHLFTSRQLLAIGTFIKHTRTTFVAMKDEGYNPKWVEALTAYLACIVSRTIDYMATLCIWEHGAEEVKHVFMRWALPITWDFAEANVLAPVERFYIGGLNSAFRSVSTILISLTTGLVRPNLLNRSAIVGTDEPVDIILTDPPYYDAIPYSDLMDFFYIWLRRTLAELSPNINSAFVEPLTPKWNHEKNDGELIDDQSRHKGNGIISKQVYEDGMYRAFLAGYEKLKSDGRLVVVFANKNPAAWETLVSSIIRAGFCVTGSWPIATEMPGGLRNLNRASLASSIWLVCKKRSNATRPGWDNNVLDEMRSNITQRLRDFWDAGIRGPDFVWAATGPAMEAYSRYPVVKKANEPGALLSVAEFLNHVRRMVVDFVVGRVLSSDQATARVEEDEAISGLDEVTTYYLLHRNDFGLAAAPSGACILYAVSCGLSDRMLTDQFDLLTSGGADNKSNEEDETGEEDVEDVLEEESSSGSTVKLKAWQARKGKNLGYSAPGGRAIPLIDQIHRLLHLWKAGDVVKVDDYLNERGLRRNALFSQVLQSLIELATAGSEERAFLESISNHVAARGMKVESRQGTLL